MTLPLVPYTRLPTTTIITIIMWQFTRRTRCPQRHQAASRRSPSSRTTRRTTLRLRRRSEGQMRHHTRTNITPALHCRPSRPPSASLCAARMTFMSSRTRRRRQVSAVCHSPWRSRSYVGHLHQPLGRNVQIPTLLCVLFSSTCTARLRLPLTHLLLRLRLLLLLLLV